MMIANEAATIIDNTASDAATNVTAASGERRRSGGQLSG
jgi:hypothetical protein